MFKSAPESIFASAVCVQLEMSSSFFLEGKGSKQTFVCAIAVINMGRVAQGPELRALQGGGSHGGGGVRPGVV